MGEIPLPPRRWIEGTLTEPTWHGTEELVEEAIEIARMQAGMTEHNPDDTRLARRIIHRRPHFMYGSSEDRYAHGAWAFMQLGRVDEAIELLEPIMKLTVEDRRAGMPEHYQAPPAALKIWVLALMHRGEFKRILKQRYLTILDEITRGFEHAQDVRWLGRVFTTHCPTECLAPAAS